MKNRLSPVLTRAKVIEIHCVWDTYLNLSLTRIAGMVLQDLDGNYLIGALLPTLHHLPECPSPEELQHLVPGIVRFNKFHATQNYHLK